MGSDLTIISIFSTIVGIINSYFVIKYSHYYTLKKKKDDIVKVILARARKPFDKKSKKDQKQTQYSVSLKDIRQRVMFMKYTTYITISLIFSLIAYLNIGNNFNINTVYEVLFMFLPDYAAITIMLFLILVGIGYALKKSNFDEKMRSYWPYIFVKSLYPTASDWFIAFLSYLLFGMFIYIISHKLNIDYLLLILIFIVFYFVLFLIIPLSFFISFRFIAEDLKLFEDLDPIIFKDVRDSTEIRIRVWTGGSVYEGKVRGIDENLVISSVDHEIHIRWDSIQAFEVIESKQSSMGKSYSYDH